MLKKLLIVSNNRKLWIPEIKDLFIVDPYVYHILEKNDELKNYNSIEVAEYRRQKKEDLINDSVFVDAKYKKYIPIIAKRLNEIHNKKYDIKFWQKALSLAFVRYITIFHNIYQNIEVYFNSKIHTCNILSKDSYYTPLDFEDHRYCFQNSDFGVEQIASIYFQFFYKSENYEVVRDIFFDDSLHKGSINSKVSLNVIKSNLLEYLKRITRATPKKIYNKICSKIKGRPKVNIENIQVGICGSFFSYENQQKLTQLSNARIYPLNWQIEKNFNTNEINWEKRKYLARQEDGFDKFDRFFFASIDYCLPKAFVENFISIEQSYNANFSQYKNLKYIVSEAWISNTYLSICLALNQARGVKHITNEHNVLTYPYVGMFIEYVAVLSDIFVSLGWYDSKITNMVRGASLFPFSIGEPLEKKFKILYISGSVATKIPHYISHYGTDEEGVPKSTKFTKSFFKSLSPKTMSEISYRRYPAEIYPIKYLTYDREYLLRNYLQNVKEFLDIHIPGKVHMLQSSLIIVDYLSTSHLEAMHMNIPTVFFWNPETYYLRDEYSDFFKPLIDVGICQTDAVKAAAFVEKIKDNPNEWWSSESVQAGRKSFFDKNLGKPEVMIDYLLSLITT